MPERRSGAKNSATLSLGRGRDWDRTRWIANTGAVASKGKADREMQRGLRVATAAIQVVAVLQPHGANDALPANTAAYRVQRRVHGIIPYVFGKSDAVHKTNDRHRRREELLQFGVAQQVGLSTEQVSVRVARRGFALLVAAHRV